MTLDELRQQREDILRIAAKHGAGNIRIFGSVAQNRASAASDVDFLIDVVDASRFRWGGGGLLMDLQNLLNCKVDLALPDELHWSIRKRVLAEAVPL